MDIQGIKEKIEGYDEFYLKGAIGITPEELNWLIEQAEKVEELEKEIERLEEDNYDLRIENGF